MRWRWFGVIRQHGFGDRRCRRCRRRGRDTGADRIEVRRSVCRFSGRSFWKPQVLRPRPLHAARATQGRTGNPPATAAPAGNRSRCRTSATARNSAAARAEHDQRQQMIGEIFRAGPRALDDFEQQHQDGERQQHVAQRHRPFGARHQRQLHHRIGEDTPGIRKTMML